ncbi:MAG: hypothetical protein QXJ28_01625 [Candidatus Pacearchaeota archaeon]
MEIIDEKSEEEKLEEEIRELKTRIKNTEYDLAHMFKGNALLERKLEISKKALEEKSALLASIRSSTKKSKKEKIKESISDNFISEEEDKIEKEIEKEVDKRL